MLAGRTTHPAEKRYTSILHQVRASRPNILKLRPNRSGGKFANRSIFGLADGLDGWGSRRGGLATEGDFVIRAEILGVLRWTIDARYA
jgi:hypothetical protein